MVLPWVYLPFRLLCVHVCVCVIIFVYVMCSISVETDITVKC